MCCTARGDSRNAAAAAATHLQWVQHSRAQEVTCRQGRVQGGRSSLPTHAHTHGLTHAHAHAHAHPRAHELAHARTHPPSPSPSLSVAFSLAPLGCVWGEDAVGMRFASCSKHVSLADCNSPQIPSHPCPSAPACSPHTRPSIPHPATSPVHAPTPPPPRALTDVPVPLVLL